jgi:hypothetical protein
MISDASQVFVVDSTMPLCRFHNAVMLLCLAGCGRLLAK